MKVVGGPMKNLFILLASVSLVLAACSRKDRDVRYAQGQGENLTTISAYDGQKEIIVTGEATTDTEDTLISKTDIRIDAKKAKMQSLPLVKYTVEKPAGSTLKQSLLDNKVLLRGRPNFKYEALYKVTENYLKIFKVGNAEDIDTYEQTYAEKLDDGRLAVPVMGYPVRFYKVEKQTNSDNEQTNILSEFSVEKHEATHMRIDFNAPEMFEAVYKEALFKADFFNGDWFFSATVISAPEENKETIGFGGATDQNYNSSERVKFIKSEGLLKAVNVNIDDRLVKTEDSNFSTAVAIPVKWKSFALRKKGKDNALSEKEDTEKSWQDRTHLELNFDGTQSTNLMDLSGHSMTSMGSKVVGVEMTDDYFSFTLQQHDSNIRVRFSFVRAGQRDYQAKRYFTDDRRVFGFFTTEKASVRNYERRRQEDIEKNVFLNRFNPKKDIVFHFTKNSPEWLRPAIRQSMQEWNRAFAAAGASSKVILDESFDVDLGDLRYNAINLIESLTGANLFGFGPSITDPYSGEIISATSNVHVTPIRSAIVGEIRNYIRHKTGELAGNYIPGMSALADSFDTAKVSENVANNSTEVSAGWVGLNSTIKAPSLNEQGKIVEKNISFKNKYKNFRRDNDLAASSGNLHIAMEEMCKDDLLPYIENFKRTKQVDSDKELEVLNSCSKKLAVSKVQGTFIHELGHNLGLRHNFRASTDKANFWPVAVTKKINGSDHQVRSSSVMEYPAFNEDRLTMTGAYDIAAIRFGYADSILLSDSKTVMKLDTNKNIKQNLTARGAALRNYKYCTDEDVMIGADPLCQRHDAGITATEIVKNMINDYNASIATMNYRYDKLGIAESGMLGLMRANRFFLPMKAFYDKFRQVLAQTVAQKHWYLEDLTAEQVEAMIAQVAQDPSKREEIIDLRDASELAFNFLTKVAMISDRYCVTLDNDNRSKLVNLDDIRSKIYFTSSKIVTSCSDAAVIAAIDPSGNTKIVGEDGYFLKDVRFDLAAENITKSYDIAGMGQDRWWASLTLTSRAVSSIELGAVMGFQPSFMDSPHMRETWQKNLEPRILEGIDTANITKNLADKGVDVSKSLEPKSLAYKAEKDLLSDQFVHLIMGLRIPNNQEASLRRMQRYDAQGIPNHLIQSYLASGGDQSLLFDMTSVVFAAGSQAKFSQNLVAKAKDVVGASEMKPTSAEEMKVLTDLLYEALPSKSVVAPISTMDYLVQMQNIMNICQGILPEPASDEAAQTAAPAKAPAATENKGELADAKAALEQAAAELKAATATLMEIANGTKKAQPEKKRVKVTQAQAMACFNMFRGEVQIAQAIDESISAAPKDDENAQKMVEKTLGRSIKAIYTDLKAPSYNLYRESIDERVQYVIQVQSAMQQEFEENKDEYDAKLNLLKTVMSVLM